jgi:hypothetical protein
MNASIDSEAESNNMTKRLASTPTNGTVASLVMTGLVALAVMGRAVDAQRSDRRQDVRIPGIGILLNAGWQLLVHDGCRFAVPGSWRPDDDAGFVSAPDGSNFSMRAFRIRSWSAHKAQIRAAFGHVKVLHEDSDHRLWFEIGDTQRTQHYIDVANGLRTCVGLLELRSTPTSDAGNTATRIADSIGPATDKLPPDSN